MYAELLPLILKITISSFFDNCLIITWRKKFQDNNYVALNCSNSNFLIDCIQQLLHDILCPSLFGNNALQHLAMRQEYWVTSPNFDMKMYFEQSFCYTCAYGVKF